MFVRLMVAALVSFAPLEVRGAAADSSSTELARKASSLAARAVAQKDPESAAVAAFEAYNLWSLAFKADGDELHLCNARSMLAKICGRPGLADEFRATLEESRDALPRCPKTGRSQKRLKRIESAARLPEFLDIPEPAAQVAAPIQRAEPEPAAQVAAPVQRAEPQEPARDVALTMHPERPAQPDTVDQPQRPVRSLRVGGAVSMAIGLLALGVMTPLAVRDAAYAAEYDQLVAKSEAAGGLTREEDRRVAELDKSSPVIFGSSLALGVTGGLATVLGASLLIVDHRRSITLAPRADRDSASISIQGRF